MAKVHCPNCHYEGSPKDVSSGCSQFIILAILFAASLVFWPLFILTAIMLIVFISKGRKLICPTCKFEHPIPMAQWEKTNGKSTPKT
mgnify:CR=1 FL=1